MFPLLYSNTTSWPYVAYETHCSHNKRSCCLYLTVKSLPSQLLLHNFLPKSHFPSLPHACSFPAVIFPILRHPSCKNFAASLPTLPPPFLFHVVKRKYTRYPTDLFHHLQKDVYIYYFLIAFFVLFLDDHLSLFLFTFIEGERLASVSHIRQNPGILKGGNVALYSNVPRSYSQARYPFLYVWVSPFSCGVFFYAFEIGRAKR